MKKKRFASFLLTGKVAAFPLMMKTSFADVVPLYTEILSTSLSVIEIPTTGIRLNTTTLSASTSTYGASSAYSDAAICSTSVPATMNVVITGGKPGDTIYLVASSNKDDGSFSALSSKVRVGMQDFIIVSSFTLGNSPIQENGGNFSKSISPISIPVDLSKLQQNNLFNSGTFYFQAVIFSTLNPSTMWASVRVSELDQIAVSSAGCPSTSSSYGGSTY